LARAPTDAVPAPREPASVDYRLLGPALLLTSGRAAAFGAAFFVPVILVRLFTVAEFGTYKQLFLVYSLLFYVAQLGIATSLFYFVPRTPEKSGRLTANAVLVLVGAGVVAGLVLVAVRDQLGWLLNNPALPRYLGALALYLLFTLVAVPLEVLMTCRGRYRTASWSYALTDLARSALLVVPTVLGGGLAGLMLGAAFFGLGRAAAFFAYLRATTPGAFTPEPALLREQLAYSLPFGLAVLVGTLQLHYHQLVVSHRFDAATFAIYAVGCLQIPIVDFVATPTGELMMVKMTEARREGRIADVIAVWHDGVASLALLFFPLVGMLLAVAHELIVLLFTDAYAASVPIFELWTAGVLLAPLLTDAVLRVYADMRFLVLVSLFQLGVVALLVGPLLTRLGLPGAVLVTLVALAGARALALARSARLLGVGWRRVVPWRRLALLALAATLAYPVALAIVRTLAGVPLAAVAAAGAGYAATYGLLVHWWGVAPRTGAGWIGRVACRLRPARD
jgi:O-antigen/teichoic acid export membrane protein